MHDSELQAFHSRAINFKFCLQPNQKYYVRHSVWRTWLFTAYSDEIWSYYQFSLHHSYVVGRMYFWTYNNWEWKFNCQTVWQLLWKLHYLQKLVKWHIIGSLDDETDLWFLDCFSGLRLLRFYASGQLNGARHWRYGAASAISKTSSKRVGGSLEGFVEHCELFLSGLLVQMPRNRFLPLVQLRNSLATLPASVNGQVQFCRAVRAQRNISSLQHKGESTNNLIFCQRPIRLASTTIDLHCYAFFRRRKTRASENRYG